MKKKNNKGFMLTETLIVATLLITVLLFMYIQFKNVMRSYEQSFKYNTISDLYALNNIKKYIVQEEYIIMANSLNNRDYIELDKCQSIYFKNQSYCNEIMKDLKIKKIYLTKQNIQGLINKNSFDLATNDFLKSIDFSNDDGYRLIGEFNDGTFGTLKVLGGTEYENLIANSCTQDAITEYTIYHKLKETNQDIFEPVTKKSGCGSIINVNEYINSTNSCLYVSGMSSNEISLSLNESINNATIEYKKYVSTLTINYFEKNSMTKISDSITINASCGDKINLQTYMKSIGNRQFINASVDNLTMTKNNTSVNLYYGLEGENIYG